MACVESPPPESRSLATMWYRIIAVFPGQTVRPHSVIGFTGVTAVTRGSLQCVIDYRMLDLVMTIDELESAVLDSDRLGARLRARGLALNAALAALIEEERKARKWSQTELAEKLGMRQSGIATWESAGKQLGALYAHNIEALEIAFDMPKGSILDRLGLVAREIDFETFVMSRSELPEHQRALIRDLYRAFTGEEPRG